MLRLLPLLAMAGCAAGQHAKTYLLPGYRFEGSRVVSIEGRDDDVASLRRALGRQGITVAASRYSMDISGTCGARLVTGRMSEYAGVPEPKELQVEVIDTKNGSRVFAAHLENSTDCPDAFFAEVAAALGRDWEPVTQGQVDQAFSQ